MPEEAIVETPTENEEEETSIEKPVKQKRAFVWTEARKKAFEKARAKREENCKKIRENKLKKYVETNLKEEVEKVKEKPKLEKKKRRVVVEESSESESDSSIEVVVRKKPSRKKKDVSDTEKDYEPEKRQMKNPSVQNIISWI